MWVAVNSSSKKAYHWLRTVVLRSLSLAENSSSKKTSHWLRTVVLSFPYQWVVLSWLREGNFLFSWPRIICLVFGLIAKTREVLSGQKKIFFVPKTLFFLSYNVTYYRGKKYGELHAFVTESDDQRHCKCCLADRVLAIVLVVKSGAELTNKWTPNQLYWARHT